MNGKRSYGPQRKQNCLRALRSGPGTSSEVGAEVGLPTKIAGIYLHNLFKRGCIARSRVEFARERGREPVCVWVYMLPEHSSFRRVVLTIADIEAIPQDSCMVFHAKDDGIHLRFVSMEEAKCLARREGGLPI